MTIDEALAEAKKEPRRRDAKLAEVKALEPVIKVLRSKGFTYDQIYDWMTERKLTLTKRNSFKTACTRHRIARTKTGEEEA